MFNRYVCAGIALLALGGIVRAAEIKAGLHYVRPVPGLRDSSTIDIDPATGGGLKTLTTDKKTQVFKYTGDFNKLAAGKGTQSSLKELDGYLAAEIKVGPRPIPVVVVTDATGKTVTAITYWVNPIAPAPQPREDGTVAGRFTSATLKGTSLTVVLNGTNYLITDQTQLTVEEDGGTARTSLVAWNNSLQSYLKNNPRAVLGTVTMKKGAVSSAIFISKGLSTGLVKPQATAAKK
jgi:hypothetical protein